MGIANKDTVKELGELYESVVRTEAMFVPPPPPAPASQIHQQAAYSTAFLNYVKSVENPGKKGFKNGKWYPFRVSSTEIDIGYGHKINPGENLNQGLTDHQVDHLLTRDLDTAATKARYYVNHTFGNQTWENLDHIRREMLIDFAFNIGGLTSFPKFVKAVVHNDLAGMKKEYVRTAMMDGKKVVISRNEKFFDTFLKNYHGGYYTAMN